MLEAVSEGPAERATVKSARRVLEVFEYFAQGVHRASVMQVANDLAFPQSSTSVLLTSLTSLGYLQFDPEDRTYAPTLRVVLLGSWLQYELLGHGSLVAEMQRLRLRTGQTVMLGLQHGCFVRFISCLPGKDPQSLRYPVGTLRPVCRSAAGKVLLAGLADKEVLQIARTANAQTRESDRVSGAELLKELEEIRRLGYALTVDYPQPNRGTLAVPITHLAGQRPMALLLGARKAQMNAQRDTFLGEMRDTQQRLERLAGSKWLDQLEGGVAHGSAAVPCRHHVCDEAHARAILD